MFFSVITKNINWEILTKNLVTFKRWDGVKQFGLGQFADLRGHSEKEEGGVFEGRGILIPQCTLREKLVTCLQCKLTKRILDLRRFRRYFISSRKHIKILISEFMQYRPKFLAWYYGTFNLVLKRNEQVHVDDS